MNLVIDVGNTFVKLAIFNDREIVFNKRIEIINIKENIILLKKRYTQIDRAIISSVGELEKEDIEYIDKHFDLLVLNAKTKLPFLNSSTIVGFR